MTLGNVPAGGADDFKRRLLSREAAVMAVMFGVSGLVIAMLGIGGFLIRLIYLAALVGYYFNVIRHVGGGSPGMPGAADALDDFPTLLGRGMRGLLCVAVSLGPWLVWLLAYKHYKTVDSELVMSTALIALGQVYMPAVLLAVTMNDSALNALWPGAWIQVVWRAPASYARFAALWLATVFVGGAIIGCLQWVVEWVPVAGMFVSATLDMYYWFAQAILVGLFIRRNAEAFGWA